jgi:hypothetical protein
VVDIKVCRCFGTERTSETNINMRYSGINFSTKYCSYQAETIDGIVNNSINDLKMLSYTLICIGYDNDHSKFKNDKP